MTWYAFSGALEQGFVYGLMVLGVYITFRVLHFPDLTVDGSLPLGAAVASVCITNGWDPYLACVPAMLAGFVAGMVTGILNTKFKILHLLASILTMIALYSINIRIMGRPNMALLNQQSVLDPLFSLGLTQAVAGPLLFGVMAVVVVGLLVWFLNTEQGQAMRATGDNPQMITAQGVDTHKMIIAGVGLSNALVALAGALVAQSQGAADVNMGVGVIVAGLASVIVGETLFGARSIGRRIAAALLGSVIYRLAIALALSLKLGAFSFTPSDINLITAILVVLALVSPQLKQKVQARARS
ncbi:ABC transporter permease [Megalodesulfovibrio gigas]|uniref:Putative ABC-type transporter, integral membrane subunit n=1 Tax=Megalodesulfovibrio gigas (strain ATCC 19364 / DSM 1382 / NCIMB 9332 / VKM B-1759) TaxID=1121448 RepID=T2GEG1_MEGG1|nr:ABC transporter permease [Megalodesulfovibrio gigas]AGW14990.1 putative ABC-type transporter, integral membrane subunit [Megalodesulfovibrio gigas DSM 1382 = ATCC 19364]